MKKFVFIIFIIVVAGSFWVVRNRDVAPEQDTSDIRETSTTYSSDALGVSFKYANRYFIEEKEVDTANRLHTQVILMEDTEWNRKLSRGEIADTEGPPTITLDVFQNNLDRQSARDFIIGSNNSNYKLGPGTIATTTKGNVIGLEYSWSGLYEGRSFVIANEDFVYMFSVAYLSPDDVIVADFDDILETIETF